MAAKNILQEIYQKKGSIVPQYQTSRIGGSDHKPRWISAVTTLNGTYSGEASNSKSLAESSAAIEALDVEHQRCGPRPTKVFSRVSKLYILIDAENIPNAVKEYFDNYDCDNIEVRAFASVGHPVIKKLSKYFHRKFEFLVTDSTRPDGADVEMILYVGGLLKDPTTPSDAEFVILTGDKFGATLCDCISSHNSKHFRCLEQLWKYLE